MGKIIERATRTGLYDLDTESVIVELEDGTRVYLTDGYGGEDTLDGGQYHWRYGIAVQVKPTDTLASLTTPDDQGNTLIDYASHTFAVKTERRILDWSGPRINRIATTAF